MDDFSNPKSAIKVENSSDLAQYLTLRVNSAILSHVSLIKSLNFVHY